MRLKTATASSAVEAFEKITDADKNNTPFGLIIIDWWPSGIDEIETARHIRQMHLSNSPRLVLISSRKHELDEATVHDAGFSICINRPVHPSMLFNAIMQAFHSVIAPGKVPAKRHKELKDVKILLAEDNEFNRQVELELLQGAGAIVSVVYNGREAVEAVKTQDFDLVLMDVQMPEMDGLTATRNIRKLDKPGIATLPILAMTANVLKQDIDDCLAAGMNDHITKPIDPAEMLAILSNYITPKNGAVNKAKTVSGRRHDENVVLPHSRPELDVAIGLSHTGGSKVFYRDMLRKFIRDFASSGTVISADLKSGKKQDAMRIAHTVKSAAGTIGALKLFAAAMELENTLHSDSSTAAPSLNRFKAQLKELVAILRNEEALHPEKDSATKTPSSPGDLNYLKKAITELEVLAEKRLPLPCREVMDSLLAYEWPVVYVTLMHDIKNMFARYRFDEVLVKLEELHKLSEQKNNLMEEDSSHDTTN
jgi:CheY-like chemotaxis protein/HPt (histidine-containing phosphotransfer) domain-containing protein